MFFFFWSHTKLWEEADRQCFKWQLGESSKNNKKKMGYNICYRQNVSAHSSPPEHQIHVETLTCNVMVLEGGVLGRRLGHEGFALMNGISALKKETPLPPLPYESTAKRQLPMNQEAGLHQTLNMWMPWPWTSQPPEVRNKFLKFSSHPGYGILF